MDTQRLITGFTGEGGLRGAPTSASETAATISVLLVDDHLLIRQGLSALFATNDDIDVVGAAPGGLEGVTLAADLQPDVVLMDLSMPDVDGVEATRRLLEVSPASRVVILTSFSEAERITAAVQAGAVGYLLKDAAPEALLDGVRAAARGEAPFDARAALALLPQQRSTPEHKLTSREREILQLVVEGLPNKSIGRRLGISEKTVKAHLTNAFAAIGVSDRTSAAIWAQRQGLTA